MLLHKFIQPFTKVACKWIFNNKLKTLRMGKVKKVIKSYMQVSFENKTLTTVKMRRVKKFIKSYMQASFKTKL